MSVPFVLREQDLPPVGIHFFNGHDSSIVLASESSRFDKSKAMFVPTAMSFRALCYAPRSFQPFRYPSNHTREFITVRGPLYD